MMGTKQSSLADESMPPAPPLDDNDEGTMSIDDEEIINSGSVESTDVDNGDNGGGMSQLRRALTGNSGAALMCNICIGPMEGPITIPCGHNYCKVCITEWFVAHDTCPLCKYVVPAAIKRDLRINVALRDFVEKAYPDIAMARLENEREKARFDAEHLENAHLETALPEGFLRTEATDETEAAVVAANGLGGFVGLIARAVTLHLGVCMIQIEGSHYLTDLMIATALTSSVIFRLDHDLSREETVVSPSLLLCFGIISIPIKQ